MSLLDEIRLKRENICKTCGLRGKHETEKECLREFKMLFIGMSYDAGVISRRRLKELILEIEKL